MRRFLASGRRRYALLLLVGAASLVVMGNTCAPTKAPAPTGLSIDPTSHDYGDQKVGTTSAQLFTVTNNGPDKSGTVAVDMETGNTNQFAGAPGSCNQLDVGQTCIVEADFKPTATGPLTTNFVVKTNVAADGTATAVLTGNGTP